MIRKINIWYILGFSIVLKIMAYFVMPGLDFPDSSTYMRAGEELFSFGQIKIGNVMPLHPIFVHLLGSPIAVKLANIVLATISIFLMYKISLKIFQEEKIALLAALIASLYPYFIFYSITGLTEILYITLLLAAFYFLYEKKFLIASIFIVVSILHRPTLDLLAPILIFTFAFIVHRYSVKVSMIKVLQYFFVYIVLMSPWWIHQYNKYDQFVRLNLGDGIVWYSGNNPMNQSGGGVTGELKGDDMNLSIFSHIVDPIEKNNAMKKAAFDFIKENPQRFVELAGVKFIRFWRLWPYASQYEKPVYIIMSLLSYGVVLIFFIGFLIIYAKEYFRLVLPILLLFLYLTAVHMILIGSIRYRLPLEPFMILMASYSFYMVVQKAFFYIKNKQND